MAEPNGREGASAEARLAAMLTPFRRDLALASAIGVVATLLWLPQAAIVADLFGALITGQPGFLVSAWSASAAFLAFGILRAVLSNVAAGLAFKAADGTLARERERLVTVRARRSPLVDDGITSAEIAALAADKLAHVAPCVTRYAPAMMRTRIVPLAILAVSFWYSWAVGVILLVTGPLIPVFMALVGLAARDASERQMQDIGSMNAMLAERIRALTDLRLLDATARTVADFEVAADRLRRQTMEVLRIAFLSSTVLELFSAIGVAMVAVYVGFSLIGELNFGTWSSPLTPTQGIFLLLLAPDFFQPLRDLAAAWHDRAAALAVAGEIEALEAMPPFDIVGSGRRVEALAGPASITTRGLCWTTQSGHGIVFPDLAIDAGGSVAITGPSGSGKTTLLGLLAGLAPARQGVIEVCGKPLNAETADAWRARMAWVGQSPHFSGESLRANLILSGEGRDDARLAEALAQASASSIVEALPRGLDTRLGETGHGVSGGEARRLMVARALYSHADIVLADEPTADLDEKTAALVAGGLLALVERGAMLIVATHDMELAHRLGQIVNLGKDA